MKNIRPIFIWLPIMVGAVLGLPLLIGIWLPDVFFPVHHTLATRVLPDGHVFRVYQYWNSGDFYNTELLITYPDGRSTYHVLDPDDSKRWRASINLDESRREVAVTGNKKIGW